MWGTVVAQSDITITPAIKADSTKENVDFIVAKGHQQHFCPVADSAPRERVFPHSLLFVQLLFPAKQSLLTVLVFSFILLSDLKNFLRNFYSLFSFFLWPIHRYSDW